MGWQAISYYVYGMILSPDDNPHQDVLLGLQHVASEIANNKLPGPRHICKPMTTPSTWWIGRNIGRTLDGGLPKFPSQAPLGAWLATDPYVAPAAATPPDAKELSAAKVEWKKFETWCFERGVDIRGRGQLLVVNDYD